MAAGPSPSPSGSSRRLSELLDQQQEPFALDLYLLERGCSPAFLDAAVSGSRCSTCWPWPGSRTAAGMTPAQQAASTKVSCASGVLRLLLCRILRVRGNVPAATAKKKQMRLPAVDRRRFDVDDGEKQRTPGDLENSVPDPHRATEARPEKAQVEEDDDSKKRLSPVSVLEQSPVQKSPPAHEQKALLIFRELLQAAYSPALLDILADAKDGSRSDNSRKNYRTKTSTTAARKNHAHWKEDVVFEEALAEVTGVIATEMAGARAAWPGDVQPERRDVGTDIAAAVLEALVEETATVLVMGMDDHDFAVDRARRHGWFLVDDVYCV